MVIFDFFYTSYYYIFFGFFPFLFLSYIKPEHA